MTPPPADSPIATPAWRRIVLVTTLVLVAAWATYLLVARAVGTPIVTSFGGQDPLTPLYAFPAPVITAGAIVFPLLATTLVVIVPRLLAPALSSRRFAAILVTAAVLLPVALFLVRQPPSALGFPLTLYPGDPQRGIPAEEVYWDAVRVTSLGDFYRNYVGYMPQLSLHGQHFPPGHATLLYAVRTTLGGGPLPAAIVILLIFAAGVGAAYGALRVVAGETAARGGALLLLACPALLDFACTSMDAVFFAAASLALWLALHALSDRGGVASALGAGLALLLATLLSFSAAPLGLLVLLLALFELRTRPRGVARALALAAVAYLGGAVLLSLGTGFDLWACFQQARRLNTGFMTAVLGRHPAELYPLIAPGNLVAFALGAGIALVAAAAGGARLRTCAHRGAHRDPSAPVVITLAVMVLAGIYVMETERIWLFAMPWLAIVATTRGAFDPPALRLLLAAGLTQTLLMELALFTLW